LVQAFAATGMHVTVNPEVPRGKPSAWLLRLVICTEKAENPKAFGSW
jgi:hypothetical protein